MSLYRVTDTIINSNMFTVWITLQFFYLRVIRSGMTFINLLCAACRAVIDVRIMLCGSDQVQKTCN